LGLDCEQGTCRASALVMMKLWYNVKSYVAIRRFFTAIDACVDQSASEIRQKSVISFDREHLVPKKKNAVVRVCLGVGDGSRLRSHSPMAKFSSRTSSTDGHAQRMRDVLRRPVWYPPTLFRHLQYIHHFTHFPHIVAVVLSAIGEHPGVVPWDCARGQA
jgi:hypothetical protein